MSTDIDVFKFESTYYPSGDPHTTPRMDEEDPWEKLSVLFLGLVQMERTVLFKDKPVKDEEDALYYKHELYKIIVDVNECEQELWEGCYVCRDGWIRTEAL